MKFLIPIVVGGIIGYFTNWLAIKMLFRPYEEKRIFGFKIPFTPGLIPKERKRVAKNIGSTIGVHLLSTETIIEYLSNQKIEEKTNKWIENNINKLKEEEKSVDEVLGNLFKENKDHILISSKTKIVKLVLNQRGRVGKLLVDFLKSKIDNFNTEKLYLNMEDYLNSQLEEISNSEDLRNQVLSKLNRIGEDDRALEEIIPEEILQSAYNYIDKNKAKIGGEIRKAFKDPIIQLQIKSSISEMISKNLNKMFFALISPDVISEKIYQAVEKYLDDEENDEDVVFLVKILLGKLLESKVIDIVSAIEDSTDNKLLEKIADKIMDVLRDRKNHTTVIELIKERLIQSEEENKRIITEKIEIEVNKFMESIEMENSIFNLVDKVTEEILNKNIGYYFEKVNNDNMDKIYKLTGILFKRFATKELPRIIELFNIEKIVEDKINSFPVEYFEELILEISHKELKAITWLGGLLGAILGLLSPLLQMIY